MALLVIQSRLEKRIHDFVEVIAGSIIGILVTVLIFQLAKIYM
jgi:diacylglycerol kinase (ATP)